MSKAKGKDRRKRVDSSSVAVSIAQAALNGIELPKNVRLSKRDVPFFESVLAEFARAEWSDHQLELAAMLARTMADLEDQQWQLRKEGPVLVIKSKKGNDYGQVNPRKQIVQMYANTILSMRRSLSLHARAREGEGRDIGKRRAEKKAIESGVRDAADDDLINRPRQSVQ